MKAKYFSNSLKGKRLPINGKNFLELIAKKRTGSFARLYFYENGAGGDPVDFGGINSYFGYSTDGASLVVCPEWRESVYKILNNK